MNTLSTPTINTDTHTFVTYLADRITETINLTKQIRKKKERYFNM